MLGGTSAGVRSYTAEEWVMKVDVRVGVGGKWTWGDTSTDAHVANGNGSRPCW